MDQVSVSAADQNDINAYSCMNLRFREAEQEQAALKSRIQILSDALEELSLCLDADGLMLNIGEAFFATDETEAEDKLEAAKKFAEEAMNKVTSELTILRAKMDAIGNRLKSKFGDQINLDDSRGF